MIIFLYVVPSAPRNFTLSMVSGSPNTLFASWNIPELINGIISGYTINCSSSDEMLGFSFNEFVLSTSLSGLTPFTNYSCTISARTSAGEGTVSTVVTTTTDKDGKLASGVGMWGGI